MYRHLWMSIVVLLSEISKRLGYSFKVNPAKGSLYKQTRFQLSIDPIDLESFHFKRYRR